MKIRFLVTTLAFVMPCLSFANSLSVAVEQNSITSGGVKYTGTSYNTGAQIDIVGGFKADLAVSKGKIGGSSKYEFNGVGYGVSYVKPLSESTAVTVGLGRLHSSVTQSGTKTVAKGSYYKIGLKHKFNISYSFDVGASNSKVAGVKTTTVSAGVAYHISPTMQLRGGYKSSPSAKTYSAVVIKDF